MDQTPFACGRRPSLSEQEPTIYASVCISCQEESGSERFTAVCEHIYCGECLASWIESALEPGATFPPQCCGVPFTLQHLKQYMPIGLIKRYELRQAEIAAACSLLCAEPGCRVIIPRDNIVDNLGHCPACNRNTCVKCRMAQHESDDCPTNEDREEVLKLAKDKKWQLCYQCNNMVELNMGCYHITCLCNAQFCYLCGTPWKECNCAQFAVEERTRYHRVVLERRTIFRADKALSRYEKHLKQTWGRPDERPREEQLEEIRAAIETGCDHGFWERVATVNEDEPGHCKLCKYVGWRFIFRCVNCPLTCCWACHTDEPPEILRAVVVEDA